jgi:hypothetical protein
MKGSTAENTSHPDQPSDRSSPPNEASDLSKGSNPMAFSGEHQGGSSFESQERAEFAPNLLALAILKQVRDRQKDRRETDPSRTQELIREARDGEMYGHEPGE